MKLRLSLLMSVAIIGLLAMGSCTKSYTCHCNFKYTGTPGLPDSSSTEFTIVSGKSAAKSTCSGKSASYSNTDNTVHTVETCYLY